MKELSNIIGMVFIILIVNTTILNADIIKIVQRYGTWIETENGDTYKRYALPNNTTVEVVDFKIIDDKRIKIKLLPNTTVGRIKYTTFDHYLSNKEKKSLKKELYVRIWATDLVSYKQQDNNLYVQSLSSYKQKIKNMLASSKTLKEYASLSNNLKKIKETVRSSDWKKAKKAEEFINDILNSTEKSQKLLYEKFASKAFNNAEQINSTQSFKKFIDNYSKSELVKKAQKNIYEIAYKEAKKISTIQAYKSFIINYMDAPQLESAQNSIYKIAYSDIAKNNNIAGYEWFIKTYPKAVQVKEAILNIHKLTFDKAKSINTISAYNTFIISYPMAKEVSKANELAYDSERDKYTDTLPAWFRNIMPNFLADIFNSIFGIFSNDEKKSRALLIKAKQIERQGNEYYGDKKAGYVMITNRMYDLLQEEYNDTDATLRFLESEEFKDFVKTFKRVMRSMNDRLDDISRYSSKILEVSKQGFSEANADRDMSEYYANEHRKWEKNMHFRDKGYQ